jgi:cytochrome c oxidase subunit 2
MRAQFAPCWVVIVLAVACTSSRPSASDSAPTSVPTNTPVAAKVPVPSQPARVIRITAKKFEYSPARIVLEKGEPVVLELVSLDRKHGFAAPDRGLRADIDPDHVTRLELLPRKVGTFEFHCDVFCGSGHEGMEGEIVVEEK